MDDNKIYSLLDKIIIHIDKVIVQSPKNYACCPSDKLEITEMLTPMEKQQSISLMRINHSGEVCAQALYHGQALMARDPQQYASLLEAAAEENNHLRWCGQRLTTLNARPSFFNPLFYTISFSIGVVAGAAGDKISLGFLAETEDQVSIHLEKHLETMPVNDLKSRAILEQMRKDELLHATKAKQAGGANLPYAIKILMHYTAKFLIIVAGKI